MSVTQAIAKNVHSKGTFLNELCRNGGRCYLKCEGRTILGNVKSGALGTHVGKGVANKNRAY